MVELNCLDPCTLGVLCVQPLASEIPVLMMVDTTGCDCEEQAENEGDSKYNEGEAKIVISHALKLVELGIAPAHIGVITPYNGQVCHTFTCIMSVTYA